MKKQRIWRLFAGIGMVVVLVGCNMPAPPQTPVFPPTLSPVAAQFTPTAAARSTSSAAAPTAVMNATVQPAGGEAVRLAFQEGVTVQASRGTLPAGGTARFLVAGLKDHWLAVDVGSPQRNVLLSIRGVFDDVPLARSDERLTAWQGLLPATQDYEIALTATGADSPYEMSVVLPQLIQFARGAVSTAIQGSLGVRQSVHFNLYALAGQTMTVKVRSPNQDMLLSLYGMSDLRPLARAAAGATEWSGPLPASQYYMVVVMSSDQPGQYLLDLTIR